MLRIVTLNQQSESKISTSGGAAQYHFLYSSPAR
jgi:hypothetical protein